jgi:hypothetical protein
MASWMLAFASMTDGPYPKPAEPEPKRGVA